MSFNDILRAVAERTDCAVQLVHECIVSAQAVKRKKGVAAGHTRLTIATTSFSPDDMFYYTLDKPSERRPKYIGIVVWVPYATYEALTTRDSEAVGVSGEAQR